MSICLDEDHYGQINELKAKLRDAHRRIHEAQVRDALIEDRARSHAEAERQT